LQEVVKLKTRYGGKRMGVFADRWVVFHLSSSSLIAKRVAPVQRLDFTAILPQD
jgi:hypothetical protein